MATTTEKLLTLSTLTYYDTKIKAWVSTELDTEIAGLGNVFTLKGRVNSVDLLPTSENSSGDIYLVGLEAATAFDEYYWNGTRWELMGTTAVDISSCVTKESLYAGTSGTGTVASPAEGTIIAAIYDKITTAKNACLTGVSASTGNTVSGTEGTDVAVTTKSKTITLTPTKGDGSDGTTATFENTWVEYGAATATKDGLFTSEEKSTLSGLSGLPDRVTSLENAQVFASSTDIDALFAGTGTSA